MLENPTVNLVALCNSCAKIACFSSELIFTFLYAGISIQNASGQFVSSTHHSILMQPHTTSGSYHRTTRIKMSILLEIWWNVKIQSVIVFVRCLESLGTDYPDTRRHVSEERRPQPRRCENIKTCKCLPIRREFKSANFSVKSSVTCQTVFRE